MVEEELGHFYSHYLEMLMFVRWLFGPPSWSILKYYTNYCEDYNGIFAHTLKALLVGKVDI